MGVVVRETADRSYVCRRVWRRGRGVIGGLLLVVAATTAMVTVIIPAVLVAGHAGGSQGANELSSDEWVILGVLGRG
jgi:hypothetical protein